MPNNIYNTATNLQAQGRFAPGVSYRADIRKPTQPVPNLPKAEASFNLDLRSIGQALIDNKKLELAAEKASKTEQDKVVKNAYMNNLARELMLNETAVDQGQYDTLTGDRKARTIIDNYLANGAAYGVTADDISGIYPKYGASTFRATQDRLDWATNIREEEQKQYNDYVKAVPSAADLPYAQALYEAKIANKQAAEFASAMERINAEPDNEANQMMLRDAGIAYGLTQGRTTLDNILTSVKSGQISGVDGYEQVRNSVMDIYMRHAGMDNTRAVNLTNMVMERMKPTIDRLGQMSKAEYDTLKTYDDKLAVKRKILGDIYNPGPAFLRDTNYPLREDAMYQLGDIVIPPTGVEREQIRGTTKVVNGKTVVTPSHEGDIISYTDIFGNERQVPAGIQTSQDAALYSAINYTEMPAYMDLASKLVVPNGPYISKKVATEVRQVGNASNVNINGADFSQLSPEDKEIVLQNQSNLVNATANNPIFREGLKNNNDTETENYIDFKARQERGNRMENEKRFASFRWQEATEFFNNSQFLRKGLVQSEDGHLLLQDDIEGVFETGAQWGSGYKGKNHLQNLNNILDATCPTAEQRKDAIASWLGDVPVWNGEAGYSTVPTVAETMWYYVGDVTQKAVQLTKASLKKAGEKVGEKVAEAVNDKENQEAVRKGLNTAKEYINNVLDDVINTYQTGRDVLTLRQNASGGLETMTNLPTFEERVKELSDEDQQLFDKASPKQREELKNAWNFYRLLRGIETAETTEDIQESTKPVKEVDEKSMLDYTVSYMQQGYPITVAGGLALLQSFNPEQKKRLVKNLDEENEPKTKTAVTEFYNGFVDNIAKVLGVSGESLAELEISRQYGYAEGYNQAASKSNLEAAIFKTLYGASKIGEAVISGGLRTMGELLEIVASPAQPIETRSQLEQRERLKNLTPSIKIKSADIERIELEEAGYVLLGTETDEEIHQMYAEMKKGSD